jgi:peptidoglycan hydrolase-like protein with peptidoglycan-binding domain
MFQADPWKNGGWGGRTSNVERASSGSEHAEVSPRVNGQCCIRTAKALATFGGANTPTDPGPIDGDFGPRTQSAVRAYQTQQNIVVDGVVGDQTWWVPAGGSGATLASLAGLVTV